MTGVQTCALPDLGFTFGWVTTAPPDGTRDRDNALDRRLAGVAQVENTGTQYTFQLDLPSTGASTVRLALGDAGGGQGYQAVQVLDNATAFITITDTDGTTGSEYDDAAGTNRTAAAWPGSNTSVARTFGSTQLKVVLGSAAIQAGSSTLAHLFVSQP